ncbi:MAG: hypothetical protein OEY72_14740, partial [Gammaproteobacteria bacterium]|nr:hypothetical protein [Gammaproteobacteria bacterium]
MYSSCSRVVAAVAALLLQAAIASAESDGYIAGLGGESDTAGGRAATVFGDISLSEKTWASALIARTSTGGEAGGLETWYVDAGVDYWFEPLGIRFGGGYWGDDTILDSNDLRASIYFRNDELSVSADYERRQFDFAFGAAF